MLRYCRGSKQGEGQRQWKIHNENNEPWRRCRAGRSCNLQARKEVTGEAVGRDWSTGEDFRRRTDFGEEALERKKLLC